MKRTSDLSEILEQSLKEIGIKNIKKNDAFFIFFDGADQPFAQFNVYNKRGIVTLDSLMPFYVRSDKLQEMMLAVNSLNEFVPSGRFYIETGGKATLIHYDQYRYIFNARFNVSEADTMIRTLIDVMEYYGGKLTRLHNGELDLKSFVREVK